jgi:uncharacterized protein YndB with AHSA1/START domain
MLGGEEKPPSGHRLWGCDLLICMSERVEVSRDIAASPEEVYAAISDVTRMGEWSPECHSCQWHEGFDGPVVGATFDGHNRIGDKEWTTQGKVTEAEPGQSFVFECSTNDFHFSTWGYSIAAIEGGSRVTEWSENLHPDLVKQVGSKISGVEDRATHNPKNISATLEALAKSLEN